MIMATETLAYLTNEQQEREFDEFFRQHYALIYRTAYGVTGSSEDAEDVLQTIFVRLLGRQFPPDLKKNPRAYLYRAAVNVSLNVIRSKRRETQLVTLDVADMGTATVSDFNEEIRKQLLEAVSQLSTSAVEVLILRYVHDYTDSQIAK